MTATADAALNAMLAALPHSVVSCCGEERFGGDGIAGGRALFGVAVTAAVKLLSSPTVLTVRQRLSSQECGARAPRRSD